MVIKVQATVIDDEGHATVCELEFQTANVIVADGSVTGDAVTGGGHVVGVFAYSQPE